MQHSACHSVGIIANPASGRDIRRLVARASVFQTAEKVNMVLRLSAALGALGVGRVLMMPDLGGIAAGVQRGIPKQPTAIPGPEFVFLDMPIEQGPADSARATQLMVEAGVALIVVLGGDGTHRVVAGHCGDVPLVTLSTGTNNTFPELREATLAGLAAGLVASGRVALDEACRRNKQLVVQTATRRELALVDVAVSPQRYIGARAVWQAGGLAEVFVAFAEPDAIGLSSIAGLLDPVGRAEPHGLYVRLDPAAAICQLTAPIAPGLLATLPVAAHDRLAPGQPRPVALSAGTLALDGEREIEFGPADRPRVWLELSGPRTVDVPTTLRLAAARGLLATLRSTQEERSP
ncbi:MAG TPA: NAD(+)/NADH kinase [Candidatus Competibacteraceae bacterium]|nr:NAD(+)/NADH kinase [Candidatus Competibacteraceae bacterium]